MNEDLRKWFKQRWVRMNPKGDIIGDCAREGGEGKPKCLPLAKARSMDKDDRALAVRRKRRQDPVADRAGKGGAPVNVATEEMSTSELIKKSQSKRGAPGTLKAKIKGDLTVQKVKSLKNRPNATTLDKKQANFYINMHSEEYLNEKNEPTNPTLWSKAKSLAKQKFDVYPSAYANGWAAKWYKGKGGGWKSLSENQQGTTMHSFVRSLIDKKKIQEAETDNLPGARTHILNKDVRDPDHGIVTNGIVLRHTGDDKYEVRAGRAKGKIISINKQDVNKLDEATGDGAFDKQMKSFKDLSISEGSVELKPSEFHAVRNGNKTIEQIAAEKKKLVGTVRGEINLHADHWSKGEDHYNKTFKEEAKDFSKYTIKPVKTEPKIVRKTNPAGRTTDHAEYEVHGTLSSHKKTFKSKKEAEEYFNTVKEEVEIDEGIKQNLRKYVPGYAKRELDKKMDAQAYEKGDSTKKTVDKDVNFGRYKKLADRMKKEEVVDEATGDKPFDNMMRAIKKGTAKQATADRKEQRKQSQQQARDAFGSSPADKLSIRKPSVAEEQKKGLWANIHAKRKRGESPAKQGETGRPQTLNIEGVESIDEISADTARSYLDKSKAAKPDLATAAKRFGGSMRAQGVIHRDELKKMSDRLAMQRKSLGLAKESSGECAVCGHTPCNCTRPIVNEVNRDTLHSYMKKANARIEGGHRSLDTQIKSGNAQAANKTAATIQKRMAGTERAEKKLGESTNMKSLKQIIAEAEQKSVHPDGIHVKPVKVNGQQKYHVHAVGKNFESGIKVGEHLSDTELDDFSEMGGRVKHVK